MTSSIGAVALQCKQVMPSVGTNLGDRGWEMVTGPDEALATLARTLDHGVTKSDWQ